MDYGPPAGAGVVPGTFVLSGDISPAALAVSQNDYNPAGLASASTIRQDASANVNLTGLAGGVDGRVVIFHNISAANTITIKDQDAGSAAANRFDLNADIVLNEDLAVILEYDGVSSRWRVAASSAGGGGGGGAPTTATYVTMSLDGTLTAERTLAAGTGLTLTDGGANGAATFKLTELVLQDLTPEQMDVPDNADWVVTGIAPTTTKGGTDDDKKVAAYDDTTEEGRGFPLLTPSVLVNVRLEFWLAAAAAPGVTNNKVGLRWYRKEYQSNTAPTAFSAAVAFAVVTLANNTFLQKFTETFTVAALSLVVDRDYTIEITRNPGVANDVVGDVYLGRFKVIGIF